MIKVMLILIVFVSACATRPAKPPPKACSGDNNGACAVPEPRKP